MSPMSAGPGTGSTPLCPVHALRLPEPVLGDFGTSFRTGRGVLDEVGSRYMNTVVLGLAAMLVALVLGGPRGSFQRSRNSPPLTMSACSSLLLGGVHAHFLPGAPADAGFFRLSGMVSPHRERHVAAFGSPGSDAGHAERRRHFQTHPLKPSGGPRAGLYPHRLEPKDSPSSSSLTAMRSETP